MVHWRCPPPTRRPAGQARRRGARRSRGRRGGAEIRRQPVAERRRAGAGVRAVPPEQLADLPPDRPEHAHRAGGVARWVARGDQVHKPTEVLRTARRRQCPHILEPEVLGEIVCAKAGGLRPCSEASWTPHSLARLLKPPKPRLGSSSRRRAGGYSRETGARGSRSRAQTLWRGKGHGSRERGSTVRVSQSGLQESRSSSFRRGRHTASVTVGHEPVRRQLPCQFGCDSGPGLSSVRPGDENGPSL